MTWALMSHDDKIAAVRSMANKGLTAGEIGERIGAPHISSVGQLAKRAGIPVRRVDRQTAKSNISDKPVSIWELDEEERRQAIARRAVQGARRTRRAQGIKLHAPKPPRPAQPVADAMAWQRILSETAQRHDVTVAQLIGPSRKREVAAARFEAMWRMSKEAKMSMPAIGRRLGDRDHTTILHGVKVHSRRIAEAING